MNIAIIKLVAITFLAGSFYAILGIWIDNILFRAGIARKMRSQSIFVAYLIAFIKVFAYTEISWFIIRHYHDLG
jgi:hypothetical protein